MRYFITLSDQEDHLDLERAAERGDSFTSLQVSEPATERSQTQTVEILTPAGPGPAIVRVGAQVFRVLLDPVGIVPRSGKNWAARVNAEAVRVRFENELERQSARPAAAQGSAGAAVRAPLPGRVVKVSVKPGERVVAGAALLTIEAMKMENEIQAPRSGRVAKVLVEAGAAVDADAELLLLEEA